MTVLRHVLKEISQEILAIAVLAAALFLAVKFAYEEHIKAEAASLIPEPLQASTTLYLDYEVLSCATLAFEVARPTPSAMGEAWSDWLKTPIRVETETAAEQRPIWHATECGGGPPREHRTVLEQAVSEGGMVYRFFDSGRTLVIIDPTTSTAYVSMT